MIPSFGILGKPWYLEFVRARREVGLREIPSLESREQDLSFLLVPEHAGIVYEVQSPMGSVELSERLIGLLSKGFTAEQLEGISSHSLKATMLSYMNVWGCSLVTSELLGYHVNREHQSALNYTRDCLSGPMREMVDMMCQLNSGAFVPHAARDAMFPEPLRRKHIDRQFLEATGLNVSDAAIVMQEGASFSSEAQAEEAETRMLYVSTPTDVPTGGMVDYLTQDEDMSLRSMPPIDVDSSSSGSDSSPSSSDSEEEEEVEASHAILDFHQGGGKASVPSESADTMLVFRHSRTKMLHYGHVTHSDRTGCGRLLSESYYCFKKSVDLAFPKCKVCFGSIQV